MGLGSEFSESVRLVAFELLQLVINLSFGIMDLVFDGVLLLLRELPRPVVLSSQSALCFMQQEASITY